MLYPSISLLSLIGVVSGVGAGWNFVQNGTSGIVALESVIISPTLALFFDRVNNDPLTIHGHPAWGAFWNLETNTATAVDVLTDPLCGSGGFLSNGTMISVSGNANPPPPPANASLDGRMSIRLLEPCTSPTGAGCTLFENAQTHHLEENRWYPSALRIFDGSMMILGGMHVQSTFYNTDPANTFEFFPAKDGGVPRPSPFLQRTVPANMFPRAFALPDGRIFIAANNRSIIYDIETNTETPLPDFPNGLRVTNPFDAAATLLPLSPPDYIPEVLVCGGSHVSDTTPLLDLTSQDPASTQCNRIVLTPAGIKLGWQVEHLLEPRMMGELLLLPNGQALIINGAQTGYPSVAGVRDPVGESNADHPALTPSLYTPSAPLGQRISNQGLPTTNIPRMYHSSVTLTPKGNFLIAGSNPNGSIRNDTIFPAEFRVEYLNPPYMSVARPVLLGVPKQIAFNTDFRANVVIPSNLPASSVKVALMDLGFSTHAFHTGSILVFLNAELTSDRATISITSPPNNRIYPPGPAFLFLTVDDVTSEGVEIMVGSGASPPVPDQGVPI